MYEKRALWGSNYPVAGHPIDYTVDEVIIHHYWRPHVEPDVTAAYERRIVRGVEKHHNDNIQSGGGTGYNFNVFQSGRGYEGRGWFRTGAHTAGRNSKSVGIAIAIDGDANVPTDKAWAKVRDIINEGVRLGAIAINYTISGHTDYSAKSCPGTRTYPLIQTKLQQEDNMSVREAFRASWDWARSLGVMSQHSVPKDTVTKEELAVFLHRYDRARSSQPSGDGLKRGDTVKLT